MFVSGVQNRIQRDKGFGFLRQEGSSDSLSYRTTDVVKPELIYPGGPPKTHTLPNGINIITERFDSPVCYINVSANVGSIEDVTEGGLAHITEHASIFCRSGRKAKELRNKANRFSIKDNGGTSRVNTAYIAHSLRRFAPISLKLVLDNCFGMDIDLVQLEREKEIVKSEIRKIDDAEQHSEGTPGGQINNLIMREVFPYPDFFLPISGTSESVDAITPQSIIGFKRKHYKPDNIIISAAGGFDEEELLQLAEELTRSKKGITEKRDIVPFASNSIVASLQSNRTNQSTIYIRADAPMDSDEKECIAARMISTVLNKRLFEKLRLNTGFDYSPSCAFEEGSFISTFSILTQVGYKNAYEALEIILRELESIKERGLTKREFEYLYINFETREMMNSSDVYRRAELNGYSLLTGGNLYTRVHYMQDLHSVDNNTIKTLARKMFDREKMTLITTGKQKLSQRRLEAVFRGRKEV